MASRTAIQTTLVCVAAGLAWLASADTYRGIPVAQENRCTPYDRQDYPYSQSVEQRIVAASEAHDSGLCAASGAVKAAFATDLLNLTLASPAVNRHQKSAKDVAEWTPDLNACWFAARTLEVRRKYGLTIDRAEAEAVEAVLSQCDSTEMVVECGMAAVPATRPASPSASHDDDVDALALWDDNGNGRITCPEARKHGIAPVQRGHPAYRYMRDGDGDGVVCE